jgi:hypothetical protein
VRDEAMNELGKLGAIRCDRFSKNAINRREWMKIEVKKEVWMRWNELTRLMCRRLTSKSLEEFTSVDIMGRKYAQTLNFTMFFLSSID